MTGLAYYRAGQLDRAIQRLNESLTADPFWSGRQVGYPVLAMAYHRAGLPDKAQEALVSTERSINDWTQQQLQGQVGMMNIPWFDWLECLCLYREAHVLIRGEAPPADPRRQTLEDRALAVIKP